MGQLNFNPPAGPSSPSPPLVGCFAMRDDPMQPGKPVMDDVLLKISYNATFAAIRYENIYMGYYKDGDTVPTPNSPVDGYVYAPEEVTFQPFFNFSPFAGSNFITGQAPKFVGDGNSGAGEVFWFACDVNDFNGKVFIRVSYFVIGGAETITNDGVVKVYAICQRSSRQRPQLQPLAPAVLPDQPSPRLPRRPGVPVGVTIP